MQRSDIQFAPAARTLQQFAAGLTLVFGVLAGAEALSASRPWLLAAYGVVAALGMAGLVRPALVRPVFVGWSVAAFPIGWVVSNTILALLFYGLFTPLGLVFSLAGRDVLKIRRREAGTYWIAKPSAAHPREYFRQS